MPTDFHAILPQIEEQIVIIAMSSEVWTKELIVWNS